MDASQLGAYRALTFDPVKPVMRAADVVGEDRTLVFGKTLDRYTFHVYLLDGEIHRVIYSLSSMELFSHVHGSEIDAELLSPDKRAYPERSDYGFAVQMMNLGVSITFTTLGGAGTDSEGIFAGLLHHDLGA